MKKFSLCCCTLFVLSSCAQSPVEQPIEQSTSQVQSLNSSQVNIILDEIFEQQVALSPTWQTYLGRKTNMDKWDDLSEEHAESVHQLIKKQLAQLESINPENLDETTELSLKLYKQQLSNQIQDHQWRLHNYPVNQMFGTHSEVPSILINQHKINSVQDAENYIARVNAIPKLFSQLISGLQKREAQGIIAPKFVYAHVIRDSSNLLIGQPFERVSKYKSPILADFNKKLKSSNLSPSEQAQYSKAIAKALLKSLLPAYRDLIVYLTELERKATNDAGIWKFPQGESFYQNRLQRTTTTTLTADQIHQIGLKEVKRIHQEMERIKDKVDFKGDLNQFFKFMREDRQFYYADTSKGRNLYLAETKNIINTMNNRLDELFAVKPKAELKVKAVEAFRQRSAGKAFYQRPAEDGSRPGLYYVNLYSMKNMPKYQLEALAYHEALPGHHMQIAINQELVNLPKFRKFGGYTAYIEGWGLYSELLPKEIGLYQDPYSDFGRLAMELWRACRLVVDTGIHSYQWTKEQATQYLVENTPNSINDSERAIERYIVLPSQATAYKIGMLKILELRQHAKNELLNQFDIRAFHNQILKHGALPLNVLEEQIQVWIKQVKDK
ncbi:lipoprotein [Catenovulum maritimum]|uniref:Lipoprotein n=1 Tax=Catenovulum maritimum TaxID=1513271 RepID=A0A0J8GQX6_9ALTE|nr:lipoprotein [Catenovulum maritimum]